MRPPEPDTATAAPEAPEGATLRPVAVVGGPGGARESRRAVARERLLTIRIAGGESFALMCTPGEEIELALGFLRAEGWIDSAGDVASAEPCDGGDGVRVRLSRPVDAPAAARRNLVLYASCGMCGREDALPYLAALEPVPAAAPPAGRVILAVASTARARQPLFAATGGSHATHLFDARGEVVAVAEDVGRHAAFDKAIGKAMRGGLDTAGLAALLSGRASLEMVAKAARARLSALAAVGAPTDAAIELADRLGLVLAGFVRGGEMTVYAGAARLES